MDTIQTDAMSVKVSQLEFKADIRYKIANVNLWSQGLSMLEMKRLRFLDAAGGKKGFSDGVLKFLFFFSHPSS